MKIGDKVIVRTYGKYEDCIGIVNRVSAFAIRVTIGQSKYNDFKPEELEIIRDS